MFLILVCTITFILVEFLFNFRKHVSYSFTMYFIAIALMFLGSALYMAGGSTYTSLNEWDYKLYQIFRQIRGNTTDISIIINIGTSLFMLSSVYLINKFVSCSKKTNIVLIGIIILFGILYYPSVSYKFFYIGIHSEYPEKAFLTQHFVYLMNYCYKASFIAYMIIPLVCMFMKYKNTAMHIIKTNTIFTFISTTVIYMYMLVYFIFGIFSTFMPWEVDLLKFPISRSIQISGMLLLFITITVSMLIVYFTFCYKPFKSIAFWESFFLRQDLSSINYNLRMLFHANKNTLIAIDKLSDQLSKFSNEPDTVKSISNDIKIAIANGINTMTNTLNMLDDVPIDVTSSTDLCSCINDAIRAVTIPKNINVKTYYQSNDIFIGIPFFYAKECIINLISNAIDAIDDTQKNNGEIVITLKSESGLACIEITDNGCGIPKKNIKNIFTLLYSTKGSSTKWGTGLAYVKKVIKAYNGFIYVKSKENKYTTFQIAVPLYEEKEEKRRKDYGTRKKNQNSTM